MRVEVRKSMARDAAVDVDEVVTAVVESLSVDVDDGGGGCC